MTTPPRVQCSAAGLFRDRHMATDRQYDLTTPDRQIYTFCSACCLLYFACFGLPGDSEAVAETTEETAESEAAA
jgi:hypothetical protein